MRSIKVFINLRFYSILILGATYCVRTEGYKPNDITIIASTKYRLGFGRSIVQHKIFNEILTKSQQLAQDHCEKAFKWDRWNCPKEDFLSKRMQRSLDRESAFVSAITTASIIFTITKSCSNGELPGCGCFESKSKTNGFSICSDNTKFAETIIDIMFNENIATDAHGYAILHNNRAAKLAVQKSMQKLCKCENILTKYCENQICWNALGSFDIIVKDLRQQYDKALIVKANNKGIVNWNIMPENVLVFIMQSLNYCKLNVIPNWKGMMGRQCSRTKDKTLTIHERRSCRNLCRNCGLKVYERTLLTERRCNCKFTWCCEVTCDICNVTEKEYYCG